MKLVTEQEQHLLIDTKQLYIKQKKIPNMNIKLFSFIRNKPSRRANKSQGMVEFALMLPVLLLVVYGLFEVGRVIFLYAIVATAARDAARYGSSSGLNITNGVPKYDDCLGIRSAAQNVDFLGVIEDNNIIITYDHGPGTNLISTCPPPAAQKLLSGDRVTVQVSADFVPIVPVIPWAPWTVVSMSSRTLLMDVQILGTVQYPHLTTYTPSATQDASNTPAGTRTNTRTPWPTPTTSLTPTLGSPTPTPMVCQVVSDNNIPSGSNVSWNLTNPHTMAIKISLLRIEWAIPNILSEVQYNGVPIFNGNTKNTGMLVPLLPDGFLMIPANSTVTFKFIFTGTPNNIRAEVMLGTLACTNVMVTSR